MFIRFENTQRLFAISKLIYSQSLETLWLRFLSSFFFFVFLSFRQHFRKHPLSSDSFQNCRLSCLRSSTLLTIFVSLCQGKSGIYVFSFGFENRQNMRLSHWQRSIPQMNELMMIMVPLLLRFERQ